MATEERRVPVEVEAEIESTSNASRRRRETRQGARMMKEAVSNPFASPSATKTHQALLEAITVLEREAEEAQRQLKESTRTIIVHKTLLRDYTQYMYARDDKIKALKAEATKKEAVIENPRQQIGAWKQAAEINEKNEQAQLEYFEKMNDENMLLLVIHTLCTFVQSRCVYCCFKLLISRQSYGTNANILYSVQSTGSNHLTPSEYN